MPLLVLGSGGQEVSDESAWGPPELWDAQVGDTAAIA